MKSLAKDSKLISQAYFYNSIHKTYNNEHDRGIVWIKGKPKTKFKLGASRKRVGPMHGEVL